MNIFLKHKNATNKKKQKGLTLIEASMVLALSSVVVAGAVMYYNSASENSKIQRAQGFLGAIQGAVQSLMATGSNYDRVTNNALIANGSIPRVFIVDESASTLSHPWGGQVDIIGTGSKAVYTVKFSSLSRAACIGMASIDLGRSMVGVTIAGTEVSGDELKNLASIANTSCADGSNGAGSDVLWTFK